MVAREKVIDELRRVASDLGRTPGRKVFEAETGIRETDWAGRHWATWGDVVAEAGLTPNTFMRRLDETALTTVFAEEIRRLGRVPTVNELKMRAHQDPSFPNAKTFYRQGGKAGMIELVRELCQTDPVNWSDVLAVLPAGESTKLDEEAKSNSNDLSGYVYLVKSGKRFKIGFSADVQRRLIALNTGMPDAGELVHVITTDDPAGIESYWHRRFAAKRVRPDAEWFDLSSEDVRAFRRRKFQ